MTESESGFKLHDRLREINERAKVKSFLTVLTLLSAVLVSGRCLAGDTVFLGAAVKDAKTGMVRIPVCLDTEKSLISLSVTLAAAGDR